MSPSADDAVEPQVREVRGPLAPWPAQALAGLLDVPLPRFDDGAGLPLGWHWTYLLDAPHRSDLGADGHPVRGVFPSPPAPGLRRMWAGGALTSLRPLRVGADAVRRSRAEVPQVKQGRSGRLVLVTVEHEWSQHGEVALRERQDVVYREPVVPAAPADPPPDAGVVPLASGERELPVSPALLFRFSALTYNGHRIHYDRDYARSVEGYPGLVTHGPLQALAMAEAVRAHAQGRRDEPGVFEYRLLAPLFDVQGLVVRADADPATGELTTLARDRSGRQTAQGSYRRL